MLEEARLLPGFFFAVAKQGAGVGWKGGETQVIV